MGDVRANGHVVELGNQIAYPGGGGVALLRRLEQRLEDPLGLVDDAEVGRVASAPLRVRRRHDAHEAGHAIKGPAPVVRRRVLGDLGRPGSGVQGAQALREEPVRAPVLLQRLGLVARRRDHDERGVQARRLGHVEVAAQRGRDQAHVARLAGVVGMQEHEVDLVGAVAPAGVDAGERLGAFLPRQEDVDKVFVSLALPCTGWVLLFNFSPTS